jgi:ribose-phosphate pyrophosphokinase
MPGNDGFASQLRSFLPAENGDMQMHHFPDGESCPRFMTAVAGRDVVLACALDRPDARIMELYLAACVARELGARSVGLVIPYLPYMRQDARFMEQEGVTSSHFARLISSCCDWLVTVDPHLHRYRDLGEIYTIPSRVVHAAPALAKWIAENVQLPVIIGPDAESKQWVAAAADAVGCPHTVLHKKRRGDREVEVSIPDVMDWGGKTPVLVDDIVSTARTMVAAVKQINAAGMAPPVCIAVHPLFAGDGYIALQVAGVDRIASCNTIAHSSNRIDVAKLVAIAVGDLLGARS